jgi:CBS domain-containing protein
MAENALGVEPPLGFFRQLVLIQNGDQADTLDVKRQGILPITGLARVYALQTGSSGLHTLDRLREAVRAGIISRDDGANLCGAYEHLATLRARHQVDQIKTGTQPDNFIPPKTLSPLERGHLKDAFGVIATMQKNLRARLAGRGSL